MKLIKTELDIDSIGGQGAMTKEEQILLSDFIRAAKLKKNKQVNKYKIKPATGHTAII